ncbi:MAG: tyrosine--tRNA ligase [Candidatus Omnitrophica bacterium]|nr:tyrosine--tRNA ligase [Candidatus Omnitrophota bacterium]
MVPSDVSLEFEALKEGAVELISDEEFQSRLLSAAKGKTPLRIKYGADPSSPDLHFGHMVALRKLRQFQDFGHTVIFIIGDFTARIGDPTQRSQTRPMLSKAEVSANAKTYVNQVFKILDKNKTVVRYNSEWLEALKPEDFLHLSAQYTVARLLERDDFHKRYKAGAPIALVEFLYPLLQGYDSVKVNADLELGGTDQKFNLLVGRELQKTWNQTPQMVMTLPLLEGTDGVQKMSKSFGNTISIMETPREMFGKIMSLPDKLVPRYFHSLSEKSWNKFPSFLKDFSSQPREGKADLAEHFVTQYHNREEALKARKEFDQIFRDKGLPEDIPEVKLQKKEALLVEVLTETGLCASKGEARRMIEQGGVRVNGEKISDEKKQILLGPEPLLLQVGKRKFLKVKASG